MSGGFGRASGFENCPHCHQYQVWREPDGDLVCVTCGWRESAVTFTASRIADPRITYPVRLGRFVA